VSNLTCDLHKINQRHEFGFIENTATHGGMRLLRDPARKLKLWQVSAQIGVPHPNRQLAIRVRDDERHLLIGGGYVAQQIRQPGRCTIRLRPLQAAYRVTPHSVALPTGDNENKLLILHRDAL
jgi:hypothetical protein